MLYQSRELLSQFICFLKEKKKEEVQKEKKNSNSSSGNQSVQICEYSSYLPNHTDTDTLMF